MIAESRIWRLALLAMVVLVLVVSAGCIGNTLVSNRDIVVLKLSPDGSLAWTKVVDNGFDDMAEDLVELPGGGYALAGQTANGPQNADGHLVPPRPVLIRLSPDGSVASQWFVPDEVGVARAVALADGGGAAVLTGNSTVVRFSPDGQVLWARPSGISEAHTLVRTANGGFLAGGQSGYLPVSGTAGPGTVPQAVIITESSPGGPMLPQAAEPVTSLTTLPRTRPGGGLQKAMVVSLAPGGAIEWEGQYDDGGLVLLQSLAPDPDRTGSLVVGYGASSDPGDYLYPRLALRLGPDGAPSSVTQIGSATAMDSIWTRADVTGYRVLYRNSSLTERGFYDGRVVDVTLDRDGHELERRSIDASIAVTWTAEGGYFSVGAPIGGRETGYDTVIYDPTGGTTFHARRFDDTGALIFDRALPALPLDQVLKVVQTADGGFAVLAYKNSK
ncbi:MAG TPA: hypothetical protein HA263_12220 [Methanoregulaceae archaeon]|nr:hypothetical protein [Methanoregulaceae archaeon]